jgi:hypothetical protein
MNTQEELNKQLMDMFQENKRSGDQLFYSLYCDEMVKMNLEPIPFAEWLENRQKYDTEVCPRCDGDGYIHKETTTNA